jgi:hypothetical protein
MSVLVISVVGRLHFGGACMPPASGPKEVNLALEVKQKHCLVPVGTYIPHGVTTQKASIDIATKKMSPL